MVNNIGSSPDSESHSYKVGEATNSGTSGDGCIKEQDRLLPIANVGRIMKQILPPNAKVSKEAKETMQECVSEFISFVTGEASDKCRKEKRKTVNGDDICWALGTLGFDDYAETLKRCDSIALHLGNGNHACKLIDIAQFVGEWQFESCIGPQIKEYPAMVRVVRRGKGFLEAIFGAGCHMGGHLLGQHEIRWYGKEKSYGFLMDSKGMMRW
ncbi:nuclear transcription factor Y subunit B-4 [Cinnamomum micranthum f. kanehirae]|uniref:Nuclear transcription factor Y subunit B-4 n=1 Tax=Cinnamomum micranthum f. kanehirae TaxID=337451 RepID=A0A3S3R4M1_9MAGN|nr:nuclear transcription factor Y subunit B-4 [Cinnamomum micranthum f. kanehirae]